jgi:hypothetical protein
MLRAEGLCRTAELSPYAKFTHRVTAALLVVVCHTTLFHPRHHRRCRQQLGWWSFDPCFLQRGWHLSNCSLSFFSPTLTYVAVLRSTATTFTPQVT